MRFSYLLEHDADYIAYWDDGSWSPSESFWMIPGTQLEEDDNG